MTRSEFLTTLRGHLADIPEAEKQEILYDYEEHFRAGIEAGKTEQAVSDSLGNPESLAKLFRADYLVGKSAENKSARNLAKAVLAVAGLGLFNAIFMVPLFFGLLGVILGLLAGSVGVTVGGLALVILYPLQHTMLVQQLPSVSLPGVILVGIGLTSAGVLAALGVAYLCKYAYRAIVQYLRANLDIIRGR